MTCPGEVGDREAHVWRFALDRDDARDLSWSWQLLSADERTRADRFRFPRDRNRYIVGRATLRVILARYTATVPASVQFEYGELGKPRLHGDAPLSFNLAHSGSQAALAVTSSASVGIDVEEVRPGFAEDRIAEHFFAPAEVASLRRLPTAQQERAFFECWTRKEAFLKGKGGGLSVPLDAFEVTFGPGSSPALVRSELQPSDVYRWTMMDVSVWFPGHVAAIAVEAANPSLLFYEESGERG